MATRELTAAVHRLRSAVPHLEAAKVRAEAAVRAISAGVPTRDDIVEVRGHELALERHAVIGTSLVHIALRRAGMHNVNALFAAMAYPPDDPPPREALQGLESAAHWAALPTAMIDHYSTRTGIPAEEVMKRRIEGIEIELIAADPAALVLRRTVWQQTTTGWTSSLAAHHNAQTTTMPTDYAHNLIGAPRSHALRAAESGIRDALDTRDSWPVLDLVDLIEHHIRAAAGG